MRKSGLPSRQSEPSNAELRRMVEHPATEPCRRCGLPRAMHVQTRSGSRCANGRAYWPTVTKDHVRRYLALGADDAK